MNEATESVVDAAVRRILERWNTVGCSLEDLSAFESSRSITLPDSYARFLLGAGKNTGGFLSGSDLTIDCLDRLQLGARALLQDDDAPGLPPDGFVFCSHQGYQFLFFRMSEGPNPPVYYYLEGEKKFREIAPSFSDWLGRTIDDESC